MSLELLMLSMGGQHIAANLLGASVNAIAFPPAAATAMYHIRVDGTERTSINLGAASVINTWLDAGEASDFEVRMVMNSGTNFSGQDLNTWLPMTSEKTWFLQQTTLGGKSGNGTVTLRSALTGAIKASAVVALDASVSD